MSEPLFKPVGVRDSKRGVCPDCGKRGLREEEVISKRRVYCQYCKQGTSVTGNPNQLSDMVRHWVNTGEKL